MKEYEELRQILTNNAKCLVGMLIKRIEILEDKNFNFEQIKNLYKDLMKEQIYENNRYLLKIISARFERGTIIFE